MLRSSGSSGIEPVVVSWTNFHYTTARFYQSEVLGGLRAVLASMDVRGVGLQLRLDVVPCLSLDLRVARGENYQNLGFTAGTRVKEACPSLKVQA